MAAYPHMIFASEAAGLSKDRLAELLTEALGDAPTEQTALKLVLDRAGYPFTFWFEDADRVGEMYADYLPDGARRRPLVNAVTVVDMSGADDPDGAQADAARTIVESLAAQDGVWVFAEATKRFVGLDYGDGAPAAPAVAAQEPVVTEPAATPEPVLVEPAAAPEPVAVEPVPAPEPAATPEPVVTEPAATPEPTISEPEVAEPVVTEPAAAPEPVAVLTPTQPEQPAPPVEPAVTPEQAAAAEPAATPDPAAAPEPARPEPVVEPTTVAAPEPVAEPTPVADPEPIPDPSPAPEGGFIKRLFGRRR